MAPSTTTVLGITAATTVSMLFLQLCVYGWALGELVSFQESAARPLSGSKMEVFHDLHARPVVLMHGMGDAAGNSGMRHIRDLVAKHLQTYAVNIPIGNSIPEEVRNSYFVIMDDQLKIFASEVRKDPRLQGGFNAMGFSQGNLLIRAYIERYNDPPVYNFVSFHGPLAGVGALPQCKPTEFICKEIDRLIGAAVYTEEVQSHLAQANYFRDPKKVPEYLKHAKFLPDLNNEHPNSVNATYKANFARLESLVLVRANKDTQVIPKESEWFGAYADGADYNRVLGFNETRWYHEDLFGLQTLDKAGKVHFLETAGDHLEFPNVFILDVIDKHFRPSLLHGDGAK